MVMAVGGCFRLMRSPDILTFMRIADEVVTGMKSGTRDLPDPRVLRVGATREWHLVLAKAFEDITFGFLPWFHETIVSLRATLHSARFKPVGTVGDTVARHGVEYGLIKADAQSRVVLSLHGNDGLKGFQRLNRSFETNCTRLDSVLVCRSSHDRADEIVSQDTGPDLLAGKFRRLTAKDIHLHGLFQRP